MLATSCALGSAGLLHCSSFAEDVTAHWCRNFRCSGCRGQCNQAGWILSVQCRCCCICASLATACTGKAQLASNAAPAFLKKLVNPMIHHNRRCTSFCTRSAHSALKICVMSHQKCPTALIQRSYVQLSNSGICRSKLGDCSRADHLGKSPTLDCFPSLHHSYSSVTMHRSSQLLVCSAGE